jgi:hypothetical protein
MYEVAERFYQQLIPQAREIAHRADEAEKNAEGNAIRKVIDEILARPEHQWFEGPNQTPPPSPAPVGNVNPTGTGDSPPAGKKAGD